MNKTIGLFMLLFAINAFAQQGGSADQASKRNQKRVRINFEDELVKGGQALPEGHFINTRTQFNYKKMIHLRNNFIPEAEKGRGEFSEK